MTVIRFIFGALNSDFEFIILPLLSWILWPSSACLVRLSKNEPVMVNLNITLWPFSGWCSKICLQSGLFFDSFLKSATCSPALTEIFLNVSPSYVNSQSWHWILYPTLWAEHLCLNVRMPLLLVYNWWGCKKHRNMFCFNVNYNKILWRYSSHWWVHTTYCSQILNALQLP